MKRATLAFGLLAVCAAGWSAVAEELPEADKLPVIEEMPDPLVMLDGQRLTEQDQWPARRDQLRQLFEHYMYGKAPPAPESVRFKVRSEEPK